MSHWAIIGDFVVVLIEIEIFFWELRNVGNFEFGGDSVNFGEDSMHFGGGMVNLGVGSVIFVRGLGEFC